MMLPCSYDGKVVLQEGAAELGGSADLSTALMAASTIKEKTVLSIESTYVPVDVLDLNDSLHDSESCIDLAWAATSTYLSCS